MRDADQVILEKRAKPTSLVTAFRELSEVPAQRVLAYAGQWFAITKTFGLASVSYLNVLIQELEKTREQDVHIVEDILQRTALIAVDDLDLFRGSDETVRRGTIHYRFFQKMCEPIGDVSKHALLPETDEVCRQIKMLFQTLSGGLAVYRVVEGIAYTIVEHQLLLFLAASKNGTKIYTENDLGYITLHLAIEKEHAKESTELINTFLDLHPAQRDELEKHISELAEAFEKFWGAMERVVLRS